jgi:hypothetical protein
MASSSQNTQSGVVVPRLVTKVPKGRSTNLGSITAAGDVVTFDISEPTRDSNGKMLIQVGPGTLSLGPGTFALECSIDGGVSWFTFPTVTTAEEVVVYGLTGQPGGDTATIFAASYYIGGFGSGALFKFGFVTGPTSGSSPVWVLVG